MKCDELKATTVYDAYWKANSLGEGTGVLVYLKEEADKVITKLKEKLVEQTTLRVWAEIQLRHNKYKRCLAMANSCSDKASAEYAASYVSCDEYYYHHAEFWVKWEKRWLELAEKFKETK